MVFSVKLQHQISDFKDTFKETLQFINQNLKRKVIKDNVVFGRFCKHDGTHITLWMDSERKPGSALREELSSEPGQSPGLWQQAGVFII